MAIPAPPPQVPPPVVPPGDLTNAGKPGSDFKQQRDQNVNTIVNGILYQPGNPQNRMDMASLLAKCQTAEEREHMLQGWFAPDSIFFLATAQFAKFDPLGFIGVMFFAAISKGLKALSIWSMRKRLEAYQRDHGLEGTKIEQAQKDALRELNSASDAAQAELKNSLEKQDRMLTTLHEGQSASGLDVDSPRDGIAARAANDADGLIRMMQEKRQIREENLAQVKNGLGVDDPRRAAAHEMEGRRLAEYARLQEMLEMAKATIDAQNAGIPEAQKEPLHELEGMNVAQALNDLNAHKQFDPQSNDPAQKNAFYQAHLRLQDVIIRLNLHNRRRLEQARADELATLFRNDQAVLAILNKYGKDESSVTRISELINVEERMLDQQLGGLADLTGTDGALITREELATLHQAVERVKTQQADTAISADSSQSIQEFKQRHLAGLTVDDNDHLGMYRGSLLEIEAAARNLQAAQAELGLAQQARPTAENPGAPPPESADPVAAAREQDEYHRKLRAFTAEKEAIESDISAKQDEVAGLKAEHARHQREAFRLKKEQIARIMNAQNHPSTDFQVSLKASNPAHQALVRPGVQVPAGDPRQPAARGAADMLGRASGTGSQPRPQDQGMGFGQ